LEHLFAVTLPATTDNGGSATPPRIGARWIGPDGMAAGGHAVAAR